MATFRVHFDPHFAGERAHPRRIECVRAVLEKAHGGARRGLEATLKAHTAARQRCDALQLLNEKRLLRARRQCIFSEQSKLATRHNGTTERVVRDCRVVALVRRDQLTERKSVENESFLEAPGVGPLDAHIPTTHTSMRLRIWSDAQ